MTESSNISAWRRQPRVNIQSPLCTWTKDDGQPGYLPRFYSPPPVMDRVIYQTEPRSLRQHRSMQSSLVAKKEKGGGGQRTKIKGTRLFFNN